MQSIAKILNTLGEPLLWNSLHKIKCLSGLLLLVSGISMTAIASPSNLDPTFGSGGKVLSSPDASGMIPGSGMALQPDGKIVMVGSRAAGSTYSNFVVARYNADGSLDMTFGTNGWTSATFGAASEIASSVAIQTDGKIVIGGNIQQVFNDSSTNSFGVVRFNSDGSIDTTFDGDGKKTIDFNDVLNPNYHEHFSLLKVGSDGKIIIAGMALNSAVDDKFILSRINPDGSYDATFGGGGKVVDHAGISNQDKINDLLILSDGKIVFAGSLLTFTGSYRLAVKLSLTGVREWTYKEGAQTGVPTDYEALYGIAMQPDGKFIVVGKRVRKIVAIRLNADGTEDSSFNNPTVMPDGQAISVAIQTDGKVVANFSTATTPSFSLIRYNTNGSLDSVFGNGGTIYTSASSGLDSGKKLLIQPDGKILVGGSSRLSSPTREYITMVRYKGAAAFLTNPLFDYDNDGRADISVFRPSENKWYVSRSTDSGVTGQVFAIAGDIPVPADFDGDGKTDFAVFRPSLGDWWYQSSINNSHNYAHWGQSSDIPRPSDFDGDGRSDYIVFRPSNNYWYRLSSSTGISSIIEFGTADDKPITGDFDGDGKSDLAIFRPSTGTFWYMSSIDSVHRAIAWGTSTDIPVPADYDGDGKTDAAVYRPSTGVWYIYYSGNGSYSFTNFGISEDKPVPADYDGDAKADIAVFRPSTGTWYLQQTTAGFSSVQFGVTTDIPTENAFVP